MYIFVPNKLVYVHEQSLQISEPLIVLLVKAVCSALLQELVKPRALTSCQFLLFCYEATVDCLRLPKCPLGSKFTRKFHYLMAAHRKRKSSWVKLKLAMVQRAVTSSCRHTDKQHWVWRGLCRYLRTRNWNRNRNMSRIKSRNRRPCLTKSESLVSDRSHHGRHG